MTILQYRFARPSHPLKGVGVIPDCPSGQIYDYTLGACRDAMGSSSDATTRNVAIGGFALVTVLGIVGAVATTYFVWRVAKKQRWV